MQRRSCLRSGVPRRGSNRCGREISLSRGGGGGGRFRQGGVGSICIGGSDNNNIII